MKRSLSLLAGMVFLLAFGMAHADDTMQWNYDKGDKMILDQDLQKYDRDQNQGTVNQMPAPDAKGSGAGGSGEPIVKEDSSEKPVQAQEENLTPDPSDNSGRGKEEPYKDREGYDHGTYRY